MSRPYDPLSPPWPHTDSSSSDETEALTFEGWLHRPPTFLFADNTRTMLVWDTQEGGGIITKYSIGKLPMRHAETVITMLMKTVEALTNERPNKKRRSSGV